MPRQAAGYGLEDALNTVANKHGGSEDVAQVVADLQVLMAEASAH